MTGGAPFLLVVHTGGDADLGRGVQPNSRTVIRCNCKEPLLAQFPRGDARVDARLRLAPFAKTARATKRANVQRGEQRSVV